MCGFSLKMYHEEGMVHLLVLEEAKLSLGCVLNCEIHQKEKDKRRPSALHVELVLQAIV